MYNITIFELNILADGRKLISLGRTVHFILAKKGRSKMFWKIILY